MPVLVTCKFDEGPTKNKGAIAFTTCLQALMGKLLQSDWSDLARIRTRPRLYACLGFLQVC